MKKYALLFRMDIINEEVQPTEQQMGVYMQQWMSWINKIADSGQLADGNHFSKEGRLLKPNEEVVESPYVASNNSLAGYIIVLAKDINEATKIAKKCPILNGRNTSVEIREAVTPGD